MHEFKVQDWAVVRMRFLDMDFVHMLQRLGVIVEGPAGTGWDVVPQCFEAGAPLSDGPCTAGTMRDLLAAGGGDRADVWTTCVVRGVGTSP